MAFSKPTFQGVVLSNGSTYVGLYRRVKKNDITNVVTTEFYYLPTNAAGMIKDYRDNAINGFYSSQSAAVANPPAGYGAFEDYQAAKHIGYYREHPFDSKPASVVSSKAQFDEAIARGANYIMVKIEWQYVFDTLSAQNSGGWSSYNHPTDIRYGWSQFDDLIDYAASKTNYLGQPVKVALRLLLSRPNIDVDGVNPSGFYNFSDSARDENGNLPNLPYNSGHTSLAHTTGVNQALDFVQKVVSRYSARLGNKFLKYSVALTYQHEAGYDMHSRYIEGQAISGCFDYSTHAMIAFKAAMQTKYGTPTALSAAWGINYSNFSDITAPTPISGANPETAYITNRGKDWWFFHYTLHKNFQSSCRALGQTYAPGAKFFIEWGAIQDWARRMSVNVADNASYCDMMKTQLGILNHQPHLAMTVDIVRSNFTKKFGTELNDLDMRNNYNASHGNAAQVEDYAVQLGRSSIDNGATDIMIMASLGNTASANVPQYIPAMMNVLSNLRAYMDSHTGSVSASTTLNYSLGDILNNTNFLSSAWAAAGGSNTNRINMVQSTDLGISTGVGAFPLPLNALHTFFVYSQDMNSKLFDYGTEEVKNMYRATKFRLYAVTHSITYPATGGLAMADWRIVGVNDGITYVRNTQNTGHRYDGDNSNRLNNNHPLRQYDSYYNNEDSAFLLPLNQNYVIYMKNTGTAALVFELDRVNPSEGGHILKMKLNPGVETSYTLNPSSLHTDNIRTLKMNCNRLYDTDSL